MVKSQSKSILLQLAIAGSVMAAVAIIPSAFAAEGATLEEIIVTARNREETLLEAPLTVTAFGAKAIEKMALDELPDFSNFTPGFHYSEHSLGKVPIILAVGAREVEEDTVTVRRLGQKQTEVQTFDDVIKELRLQATPPDMRA